MPALIKYENVLVKRYNLPDRRCVYTPDVYWRLTKEEQDTLHRLRRG